MPTSLVASIILQHRNGISAEVILKNMKWLKNEIKIRNGNLHVNPIKSQDDKEILKNSLDLLSDCIINTRSNPNFLIKKNL
jgi:hypothetical protein